MVAKKDEHIFPRRILRRLTPKELVCDSEVKKRADFDAATKLLYGDLFNLSKNMKGIPKEADDTCDPSLDEVAPNIPEVDLVKEQEKPLHPTSAMDTLMNAEVLLPQGGDLRLAKVIQMSVDSDGKVG